MPFDDDGFTSRSPVELTEDFEEKAIDLFDVVNFSPSALLWQLAKIHILDNYEHEVNLETMAKMMSIQTATGEFLVAHGIEAGLEKREGQKSEGYVNITDTISGAPISIPVNTEFQSSRNSYFSDELSSIPYEIAMAKTRTGESNDYFPSTVVSAANVVEILDEDGNVIDSSYYSLDATYLNNIQWTAGSSAVIIENEPYTVRVSGNVTARIEVTSENTGTDSAAETGEIASCPSYPTFTVINTSAVEGGTAIESDETFRARLLAAKRRNFTLGKVESIANGINGVRSAKAWQDKGVDQSSVVDWENPSLTGWRNITGTCPRTSQHFVPGDLVLSLGRITVSGRAVNDPPDLMCGLRLASGPTGIDNYLAWDRFAETDLDPTITGVQDIHFDMKFNSMDKTKTYAFDLFLDRPLDSGLDLSSNYWTLRLTNEGYRTDDRGALNYLTGDCPIGTWGAQGTGVDLMFKTWYNGAGYTVMLAPDDGYGFDNLEDELDGLLDYIDGEGYSPIGIQYVITEAEEVLIDIRGYVHITELANFVTVREEVLVNIENYLENLQAGDNVVYSRVEYETMRHPQVWKQTRIEIKRSDISWDADITENQKDVYIAPDEIADLGIRSIKLGPGTL